MVMDLGNQNEKRRAPRYPALSEHTVEFEIPSAPIYQLKCQDVSERGAGVIVKPDSKFLDLIKVDQQLKVKLLSPGGSQPSQDIYQIRIAHITQSSEGRFKGHVVVGIELLHKISAY
jgi:hypothetical protein